MPRIPIYNSRVSAPGPIPGLGDDLAKPGRALQRLGGAIVGFGEDLARKAAAEKRAAEEKARREKEAEESREAKKQRDRIEKKIGEAHPDEPDKAETPGKTGKEGKGGKRFDSGKRNQGFDIPDNAQGHDPDSVELLKWRALRDVKEHLDRVREDARLARLRTDALARATGEGDASGLLDRALAEYDEAVGLRTKAVKDVSARTQMEALAQDHRSILRLRAAQRRNAGRC